MGAGRIQGEPGTPSCVQSKDVFKDWCKRIQGPARRGSQIATLGTVCIPKRIKAVRIIMHQLHKSLVHFIEGEEKRGGKIFTEH